MRLGRINLASCPLSHAPVVCHVAPLVLASCHELVFRASVIIAVCGCQTFTACTVRHFLVFRSCIAICASSLVRVRAFVSSNASPFLHRQVSVLFTASLCRQSAAPHLVGCGPDCPSDDRSVFFLFACRTLSFGGFRRRLAAGVDILLRCSVIFRRPFGTLSVCPCHSHSANLPVSFESAVNYTSYSILKEFTSVFLFRRRSWFWFRSDSSGCGLAWIRFHLYLLQIGVALGVLPSAKIVKTRNKLLRSASVSHYLFTRSQTTSFRRASGAGPV